MVDATIARALGPNASDVGGMWELFNVVNAAAKKRESDIELHGRLSSVVSFYERLAQFDALNHEGVPRLRLKL